MDDVKPGQPFGDVSRPGATPAQPNSRPVITNNTPPQSDPMVSGVQAPITLADLDSSAPNVSSQPEPSIEQPVQAQPTVEPQPVIETQATPMQPAVFSSADVASSAEPVHALQPKAAFYGQVGKHPRSKKWLVIVAVIALLAAAGVGGWMYWQNQNSTNISQPTPAVSTTPAVVAPVEDKLFESKTGGFSLTNKYDWKVTEADTTSNYDGLTDGDTYAKVEFAISDTQKLIFDVNPGGRGGDCLPKTNEVAFKPNNTCSSFKATALTKLPVSNFPKNKLSDTVVSVYLEKFEYMNAPENKLYTFVGISSSTVDDKGKEIKPVVDEAIMGLYEPYTLLAIDRGYIDIKIVDQDGKPTQLSEANLAKVETVLKSLKLTD